MIYQKHNSQILPKKTENQKFLTGFTVLELLIVIAIVGIITSVLLVAFKGAMERARIARGWQFSDSLRGALQMDMVAWWPLDRVYAGSPPTTPDSWFDRLDGTVYGATTTEGIVNGALSFNGVDDYVEVSHAKELAITDNITLEAWISPNVLPYEAEYLGAYIFIILTKQTADNGPSPYQLALKNTKGLRFWDGQVVDAVDTPIARYKLGIWNHVVVVRDSVANKLYFYVDGIPDSGNPFSIGNTALDGEAPLRIGRHNKGDRAFRGFIDDVRIYNQALPAAAIQQHYAEGLKRHQDLAIK